MWSNRIQSLKEKPIVQALCCVVMAALIQITYFLLAKIKVIEADPVDIWSVCPTLLLLYILLNVVFGFSQHKINFYYRDSIYGFVGFLFIEIVFCTILTDKSYDEVKSISWILFVFGIVYLVFMSILNLIRFIVTLALKQDKRISEESKK